MAYSSLRDRQVRTARPRDPSEDEEVEDPIDEPGGEPSVIRLQRQGPQGVAEGTGDTTEADFRLMLDRPAAEDLTVSYRIEGVGAAGVAASADDFAATTGTVVVAAGEGDAPFTININGDSTVERNETYRVVLTGVTGGDAEIASGGNQARGTIRNDDFPPPALWIERRGPATVFEGNSGTATARFVVRLERPVTQAVTVSYTIAGNGRTAASDSDFAATTGTVTIEANRAEAVLAVAINGDTTVESNETYAVRLTGVTSGAATLNSQRSQVIGTIQNDDQPPPTVRLERRGPAEIQEGGVVDSDPNAPEQPSQNNNFVVRLGRPSREAVTVTYEIVGTGTNPASADDFESLSGSVTIAAGQNEAGLSLGIVDDSTVESTEGFQIRLTGISSGSARLSPTVSQLRGTIRDNDRTETPGPGPDDGEDGEDGEEGEDGGGPRPTPRVRRAEVLAGVLDTTEGQPLSGGGQGFLPTTADNVLATKGLLASFG